MDEATAIERSTLGQTVRAYVSLTKPGVVVLLLVTAFGAMLVAAQGLPDAQVLLGTLLGGALTAAGAHAVNCYLDRDIDSVMRRTLRRAIPSGLVDPSRALLFGLTLETVGVAVFALLTNWLAAVLALSSFLFYVLVYTRWLKRTTPSNIVIGGAAGAMPPVIAWAAVTGEVSLLAVFLFAIIFYWTPPHFWALALLIQKDYARARIPMLPVVYGEEETRRQILLYTLLLLAVSLFVFAFKLAGLVYLGSAVVLGGVFLYLAARLFRDGSTATAARLFHYSNAYLALLLLALVLDRHLPVR